jgi:ABC-type glutathione transport system ATPase component
MFFHTLHVPEIPSRVQFVIGIIAESETQDVLDARPSYTDDKLTQEKSGMGLQIEGLSVRYGSGDNILRDASLNVRTGEFVGLTGESGCGKSTLALAVMNLLPAAATVEGRVMFEGQDLRVLSEPQLQRLRGKRLSLVWQEPKAALNPVLPCGWQVAEVVRAHEGLARDECRLRAAKMLERVGLDGRTTSAYPHQLSGGQLQRVVLAQALVCSPALVIADEPTASLDTVTQAEIVRLVADLQRRLGTAILFITHNRRLLSGLANRVCTIQNGEICSE